MVAVVRAVRIEHFRISSSIKEIKPTVALSQNGVSIGRGDPSNDVHRLEDVCVDISLIGLLDNLTTPAKSATPAVDINSHVSPQPIILSFPPSTFVRFRSLFTVELILVCFLSFTRDHPL